MKLIKTNENSINLFLALFLIALVGCQNTSGQLLAMDESQVKLRQMQTRAFDTTVQKGTLRIVIATMQDLGFVIDNSLL